MAWVPAIQAIGTLLAGAGAAKTAFSGGPNTQQGMLPAAGAKPEGGGPMGQPTAFAPPQGGQMPMGMMNGGMPNVLGGQGIGDMLAARRRRTGGMYG